MAEFLKILFLLLIGFGVGFLMACYGAARIVVEKTDLKKELEQVRAERDLLADLARKNTKTIEIKDERTTNPNNIEYGNF